ACTSAAFEVRVGSAAASSTTCSMPSSASRIAAVSPVGPAPTTTTSVAAWSTGSLVSRMTASSVTPPSPSLGINLYLTSRSGQAPGPNPRVHSLSVQRGGRGSGGGWYDADGHPAQGCGVGAGDLHRRADRTGRGRLRQPRTRPRGAAGEDRPGLAVPALVGQERPRRRRDRPGPSP